jgi:hypothetical protein
LQRLRRLSLGMLAVLSVGGLLTASAGAQFFEDRFPFGDRGRGWFQPPSPPPRVQAPVDYSHAPPPRKYEKNDAADLSTVMVMGDSMADWLGYGLESAFSESPEIAVTRKPRPGSSLIVNEHRKSRTFDWVANAKEVLAKEQASVIVMMIGLADREPIHETRPAPKDAKAAAKPGGDKAAAGQQAADGEKPANAQAAAKPADAADSDEDDDRAAETARGGSGTYPFKTEKWAQAYGKRVDEMMQALKSKNVPVIWVGLPPVRGPRAMSDMQYLDDIYKAHAEKNGVTYVDVWDAFVDENGRYAQMGPDTEGQSRRLRTADGVYFTAAGARKLALYAEKEIRRAMTPTGPIAIPIPVEPGTSTPDASTGPAPDHSMPRPLAGPVMPLNATGQDPADTGELAGGSGPKQTITDAVASRVLAKGEALPVPAGRADDFAWPRRAPAPLDADPVVARTTLPMTPMLAERPGVEKVAAAPDKTQEKDKPQRPRVSRAAAERREARRYERQQQQEQQRSPFFFFFSR